MKLIVIFIMTFTAQSYSQDMKKAASVICANGETYNFTNPTASYLLSICRKKGGMSGVTSEEKVISLGHSLNIEVKAGGEYVANDEAVPSYNTLTIAQMNAAVVNDLINTKEATISDSDLNLAKLTEAIVKEESTSDSTLSKEMIAYEENVFTETTPTNIWAGEKEEVIVADTKEEVIVADTKEEVIVADTKEEVIVADVKEEVIVADTREEVIVADVKEEVIVADVNLINNIDVDKIEITAVEPTITSSELASLDTQVVDQTTIDKNDNGKKIGLLKK